MAAPNVTVQIVDQSFVARGSENISTTVGAAFSKGATGNLLTILGTANQNILGYMQYDSLNDWVSRYNTVFNAFAGLTASGAAGHPYKHIPAGLTGVTLSVAKSPEPNQAGVTMTDGTIFNGLISTQAKHWWAVANFLQYGGTVIVAGETGSYDYLTNPIMDKGQFPDVDVVFALDAGDVGAATVNAIVGGRDYDTVGIVGASGSLVGFAGVSGVSGVCYQNSTLIEVPGIAEGMDKNGICIYGDKIHFGLDINDSQVVRTPLIADFAGCICRTDRDFGPWWSPAGLNRGRILNSIRLADQPSKTSQDDFYNKGINFAITVPGEGSFVFGDRTLATTTSTFSRINVIRLFLYLTNTIGPLARRFLFEFNDETTRSIFTSVTEGVLRDVQAQRGITEYEIICDETNNPGSVVDANQFVADIKVKPAKSINFITIRFTNQNT